MTTLRFGILQLYSSVLWENAVQVSWNYGATRTRAARIIFAVQTGVKAVIPGQPQGDPIVSYGPFIGDTKQDIAQLFAEYQSGQFPRLANWKPRNSDGLRLPIIVTNPPMSARHQRWHEFDSVQMPTDLFSPPRAISY